MKSYEDTYGQAIALENIAKTYEYMANLTKACETLEQVPIDLKGELHFFGVGGGGGYFSLTKFLWVKW